MSSDSLCPYNGPAHHVLAVDEKNFRDRKFLRFSDREVGFATDFHVLEQSLKQLIPQQQESGSFLPPEILCLPEKSDDHLGVAGMLAYYLTLVPDHLEWREAVNRAVRFQLDHLLWQRSGQEGRYVRYEIAQDSALDWCNTLWVLMSASQLLKHGKATLSADLYAELRDMSGDLWTYLSRYPVRDENPCHNQLLEYAAIGYGFGAAADRADVREEALHYYHTTLRRLRVKDRGRWIYTEFNRWCGHYALLSWSALEHLFAESRDPLCEEDALDMAAAFNDRLSAGGYVYGGSRRDEPGYEEFLYPLWLREKQFGFDRLLLHEPSDRWRQLTFDGHCGRCLSGRMPLYERGRPEEPLSVSSSLHVMRRGACSVFFNADASPHHISVEGMELLEVSSLLKQGGGVIWRSGGTWREDDLIADPPPDSELHHYSEFVSASPGSLEVRARMQRGHTWEFRQWWVTDGRYLACFHHLLSHSGPRTDSIRILLGNPYLQREGAISRPIRFIEVADVAVSPQGEACVLEGPSILHIGPHSLSATHPLEFCRPSRTAFHGFPTRDGARWSTITESNRIELILSDHPYNVRFRESFFSGVQIGARHLSPPEVTASPGSWQCRSVVGIFQATENSGVWSYQIRTAQGGFRLPSPVFGAVVSSPALS